MYLCVCVSVCTLPKKHLRFLAEHSRAAINTYRTVCSDLAVVCASRIVAQTISGIHAAGGEKRELGDRSEWLNRMYRA